MDTPGMSSHKHEQDITVVVSMHVERMLISAVFASVSDE